MERLATAALDGNALGRQYFVLQCKHAGCRLVDLTGESERAGQNRLELLLVLSARGAVFVLHNQRGSLEIELQQLAGGQLVVKPVHCTIL